MSAAVRDQWISRNPCDGVSLPAVPADDLGARPYFSNAEYFAFVGTTGSGKSTAIDATTFALTVCAALVDLAQIGFMITFGTCEDPDAPIIQQEVFGPVATFEGFDENDAIHRANATEFGLPAGVFTCDVDRRPPRGAASSTPDR